MIKDKLNKRNLIPHIEVMEENKPEQKPIYQEIKLDLDRIKETTNDYKTDTYQERNTKIDINYGVSDSYENEFSKIQETLVLNNDMISEIKEPEDRLPELYPVGLVHGTYIICQNEKGMYIIDQHAAKERINYELYMKKLGNPNDGTISMLMPLTLEFSTNEFIILKENLDFLKNVGFEIDEFGMNSIIVKSHPTWLKKDYEEEQIRKIIEVILTKGKDFSIEKFNEKIATTLACKMSIKANMNITNEEMENLINDLRKCNNPFNCPHGRPTVIYYSNYDLEKLFKRSGF